MLGFIIWIIISILFALAAEYYDNKEMYKDD